MEHQWPEVWFSSLTVALHLFAQKTDKKMTRQQSVRPQNERCMCSSVTEEADTMGTQISWNCSTL